MSTSVHVQIGARRIPVAGVVVRQPGLAGTAGVVTAPLPSTEPERPVDTKSDNRKSKDDHNE